MSAQSEPAAGQPFNGAEPGGSQRDLLQLVAAASRLAELRPGTRCEVP